MPPAFVLSQDQTLRKNVKSLSEILIRLLRSRSHYDLKFIFGYIALFSFQTATAIADGIPRQKRDTIQFSSLFVLVKLKTEKFSTFFRLIPADPRRTRGPQYGRTNNLSHFSRLSSPKQEKFSVARVRTRPKDKIGRIGRGAAPTRHLRLWCSTPHQEHHTQPKLWYPPP